jgi:hypothetical protein
MPQARIAWFKEVVKKASASRRPPRDTFLQRDNGQDGFLRIPGVQNMPFQEAVSTGHTQVQQDLLEGIREQGHL